MAETEHIQLAHGGGGVLTAELVEGVILPALSGPQTPGQLTDSAILDGPSAAPGGGAGRLAFTTDGYVVQPLEFPGGDIGKLAVCGTINDLAVAGARPLALSMSLVLEEGLAISLLRRVLVSAGAASAEAGVAVVTGDTKVVQRGGCDGMTITTSGLGHVPDGVELGFARVGAGDRIVLSGPLGEHGLAVMSRREGLSFSSGLESDCASLHELTGALVARLGGAVRFMRDPTRGGLAATLAELSAATGRDVEIEESAIPPSAAAATAAELLGLDVLNAANEGKLVAVVAGEAADEAVRVLAGFDIARGAAVIGSVGDAAEAPLVEMLTRAGGRRIIQMPLGEELPRIC